MIYYMAILIKYEIFFKIFACSDDESQLIDPKETWVLQDVLVVHGFINFTLLPSHNLFWLLIHAHNLEIKNIKARPYYSYGAHMVLHM